MFLGVHSFNRKLLRLSSCKSLVFFVCLKQQTNKNTLKLCNFSTFYMAIPRPREWKWLGNVNTTAAAYIWLLPIPVVDLLIFWSKCVYSEIQGGWYFCSKFSVKKTKTTSPKPPTLCPLFNLCVPIKYWELSWTLRNSLGIHFNFPPQSFTKLPPDRQMLLCSNFWE